MPLNCVGTQFRSILQLLPEVPYSNVQATENTRTEGQLTHLVPPRTVSAEGEEYGNPIITSPESFRLGEEQLDRTAKPSSSPPALVNDHGRELRSPRRHEIPGPKKEELRNFFWGGGCGCSRLPFRSRIFIMYKVWGTGRERRLRRHSPP